jgi:Cof subfamily protein (haloacid dehalogenase superfamily)
VVAIDLDGTILPADFRLPAFTAEVLKAVQRGGSRLIINTGRMYRSALPYARALAATGALSCYQGALIKLVETGEVLLHQPLSADVARPVLETLEAEGVSANIYQDDVLHVAEMNDDIRRYVSVAGVEARAVGRLSCFLRGATTKIVAGGEPRRLDEVAARLKGLFPELYVVKSHPVFLEIVHPKASKSQALAYLGKRYGFGPADVIAFGDSYNDADALAWAAAGRQNGRRGLGVAVENAPDEVKAAANLTCAPVEQEGVAHLLLELARPR